MTTSAAPRAHVVAVTRSSGVVTPPLHGDFALEVEDLDPLDRGVLLLGELVPAKDRVEEAEIGPAGHVARRADLGRREERVAGERRRRVATGRVAHVAERIV